MIFVYFLYLRLVIEVTARRWGRGNSYSGAISPAYSGLIRLL